MLNNECLSQLPMIFGVDHRSSECQSRIYMNCASFCEQDVFGPLCQHIKDDIEQDETCPAGASAGIIPMDQVMGLPGYPKNHEASSYSGPIKKW